MKCPNCGERRIMHPIKKNECIGCINKKAATEYNASFNGLPKMKKLITLMLNATFCSQKPREMK